MRCYLLIGVLLGDKIVEADALATPEGHRAIIGNVHTIEAQQDVALLDHLVGRSCRLDAPDQHTLLVCLQPQRVGLAALLSDKNIVKVDNLLFDKVSCKEQNGASSPAGQQNIVKAEDMLFDKVSRHDERPGVQASRWAEVLWGEGLMQSQTKEEQQKQCLAFAS